jgi:hypothetical protein
LDYLAGARCRREAAGTTVLAILERAHERAEQITAAWRSPVPEAIVEQLERLLQ